MTTPLYQPSEPLPLKRPVDGHAGLWYDKFPNKWQNLTTSEPKFEAPAKAEWIGTVTGVKIGDAARLTEYAERQQDLLQAMSLEPARFKTTGPFVTGLGREHPVENGFAWHATLGTPYLPGSSVKGLVCAWASEWADAEEAEINRIFGIGGDRGGVGSVIFLDMLPVVPVELTADVMTPHYTKYYQSGDAPGDYLSPTPIPFLAVAAGATFHAGVLPRGHGQKDIGDAHTARKWLTDALLNLGAGAKTAAGYGRMNPDQKGLTDFLKQCARKATAKKEATVKAEEEARLEQAMAGQSEHRKAMEREGYSDKDPTRFKGFIGSNWMPKLRDSAQPQAERREIAGLLADFLQRHFPALWANPVGKEAKDKDLKRIKEVQQILKNLGTS